MVRLYRFGCLIVAAALGSVLFAPVASATPRPDRRAPEPGLFEPAADDAAQLGDREPWELRRHLAAVSWKLLAPLCDPPDVGRPDDLTLNLFPGVTVIAEADEFGRANRTDALEWTGGIADVPDSSVTLTVEGLCDKTPEQFALGGSVKFNGEEYTIEPRPAGKVMISEIDTEAMGLLQKPDAPAKRQPAGGRTAGKGTTGKGTTGGDRRGADQRAAERRATPRPVNARRVQPKQRSIIDLLVLYTPGAVTEAGGQDNIQSWVNDAVARANDNLTDSGVEATFRLVHMEQTTDYTGPETVVPAFNHLTNPGDGQLDQAQRLRDQYGADVVTTVVKEYDQADGIAGLASYPENPKNPASSDDAWSVVAANQLWSYLLAHELGHLLGLDHDWRTSPESSSALPDNHGYVAPNDEFVTIMGYPSACSHPCPYAGYFANPKITHDGLPLGVALGSSDHPADNTRVMNLTAPEVAAYREPKTALPNRNLTVSSEPPAGGTATPDTPGPYAQGDAVTVGVRPAPGYAFAGWTLDGKPAGSTDPLSVEMHGNHSLVARFTETGRNVTYHIDATEPATANGTISLNPPGPDYAEGTTVLATAKPKEGYELSGWLIDGNPAGDDTKLTIRPSANRRLAALFTPENKKVATSVSPPDSGKVILSPTGPYAAGADVVAEAAPSKGYAFDHWELDGQRDESEAVTSFSVDRAENLVAHFKPTSATGPPQVIETPLELTPGPPTLQRVEPASGPIGGGTKVVITGTGLGGITTVTVGGVEVPSWTARFNVKGVDIITAYVPAHAAGRVPIVVVTRNGKSDAITYTYVKKRS